MIARIEFKHQVTATPGFHWLYDWCVQLMWQFSGAPEDPEDDTMMEKHCTDAEYWAVNSLMHPIRTEDKEAQQNVAHQMIEIAKPWTIRRWWELKLANGKRLGRIWKPNAHFIDLEWTEEQQAHLKTLGESYTSRDATGVWRIHRWWLVCPSLELEDTEECNTDSERSHDEWPLHPSEESLIVRLQSETHLPILVKELAENPEPDQDDAWIEMLHAEESIENAPPNAPLSQKALVCSPHSGQFGHLKWWQTKFFVDQVHIFHMHADMGNDECTEMQLKFQDSRNPSVSISTPKVSGTGLNLTAANHAGLTQKVYVLNEQWQAFAQVVWLGQNQVPQIWLLNTGPGGNDNRVSDLQQHSGVVQMRVLHGLISWWNITTLMIHRILGAHQHHTKRVTGNGDTFQSDEQLILEC